MFRLTFRPWVVFALTVVTLLGGLALPAQAQISPDNGALGFRVIGSVLSCSRSKLLSALDQYAVARASGDHVALANAANAVLGVARKRSCSVIELKDAAGVVRVDDSSLQAGTVEFILRNSGLSVQIAPRMVSLSTSQSGRLDRRQAGRWRG